MRKIHIDFAPCTPRRVFFQTHPLTWLAGGVGIALCAAAALNAIDVTEQRVTQQAKLQQVSAQLGERTARKPARKKSNISDAQAAAVNSAVAQLNLPWREVLNALEAATSKNIALLALEPDAKKLLVKGIAETKSSDEMIAYVERLKQQPFFVAVMLTKHEVNEQDASKPLRFQFEAQWREAGE